MCVATKLGLSIIVFNQKNQMPDIKKHRVPFEKLIIGPITVVGEMMSGGHWMEMLKIQRQAATYGSYGEAAVRFFFSS